MQNSSQFDYGNGLVFYNEKDIQLREYLTNKIYTLIRDTLHKENKSITFERVETPTLLLPELLKSHIEQKFELIQAGKHYLRPETTKGLYKVLENKKLPHCVWQIGKSYRDEKLGKFRIKNLRFREFYQLEFEIAFSENTKCDYMEVVKNELIKEFGFNEVVPDDLPHYSKKTIDLYLQGHETVALSYREDFNFPIFEVSVGMDRLVYLMQEKTNNK